MGAEAPDKPLKARKVRCAQPPANSATNAPSRNEPAGRPQAPSTPVEGPRNPPQGESRPPSAAVAEPDSAGTACALPWVTPQRRAKLQQSQRQLDKVQSTLAGTPAGECLAKALSLVTEVERDMLQVVETVRQFQNQSASDLDRRNLYWLQDLVASNLPLTRLSLSDTLRRLLGCNALKGKDLRLLNELYNRMDDAYDHVFSSAPPWSNQTRQLQIQMPPDTRDRIDLTSHSASGRALRALVADNPAADSAMGTFGPARYFQAPDLNLTSLRDSRSHTLYSGLRHSILHAHEITGIHLSIQAEDDALREVFQRYRKSLSLQSRMPSDRTDSQIFDEAENDFLGVRTWPIEDLNRLALSLRAEAGRDALIDVARAALTVSAEHLHQAISAAEVRINLFSIALLTYGDVDAWRTQNDLFHHAHSLRIQVALPQPGGAPATIEARCNVRQFALPVDNERLPLDGCFGVGAVEIERLLGPLHRPQLGGEARLRVDAISAEASQLHKELRALDRRKMLGEIEVSGRDGAYLPNSTRVISKRQAQLERLQRTVRTIKHCGQYLKRVWANDGNWPLTCDVPRQVGAPLLLLGACMGEIPLVSCAGGGHHSGRLEADAMLLALIADRSDGKISSMAPEGAVWQQARAALRGNGGAPRAGQ